LGSIWTWRQSGVREQAGPLTIQVPGENVLLNDPLTVIAAIEAIIGLLIEITFIATFTQRYFGAG
jgi:hypothetical protein